jgi:hypothetical protein
MNPVALCIRIPFKIYLRSQLRLYWCYLLFSLLTTCFGPYGPSSGEIQLHQLPILEKLSILQRIRCFTIAHSYGVSRPPLWSSRQSSWLQIRRPGFDSPHYQNKKGMGLERGPLSLVSRTEELLDRKVVVPV